MVSDSNTRQHWEADAMTLKCANSRCSSHCQKTNFGTNREVTGSHGHCVSTGAPEAVLVSSFSSFYQNNCLPVFSIQEVTQSNRYHPGHCPWIAKEYSSSLVKNINFLISIRTLLVSSLAPAIAAAKEWRFFEMYYAGDPNSLYSHSFHQGALVLHNLAKPLHDNKTEY